MDKSLVIAEAHGDATRYRLLETLRQYGAEKLAASGEEARLQRVHAECYLQVAESVASDWFGPDVAARIVRLTAEQDNLRAALAWTLADATDERIEHGLRITASLEGFWFTMGQMTEARRWYELMLGIDPAGGRPPDAGADIPMPAQPDRFVRGGHPRVATLSALATAEGGQSENDAALAHAQEGQRLALQVGDRYGLGHVLADQANTLNRRGQIAAAAALFEEALGHFRALGNDRGAFRALSNLGGALVALGDRQRARQVLDDGLSTARAIGWDWGAAQVHRNLGLLALSEGDLDRAEASLSEAVAINRNVGASNGLQGGLLELGSVLLVRGEYARAMASLRESLVLCQAHGDPLGIVQAVEGVAAVGVATSSGASATRGERAGRLLGAAAAQRAVRGAPLRPTMRPIVEQAEAAARAQLGDAAYEGATGRGPYAVVGAGCCPGAAN